MNYVCLWAHELIIIISMRELTAKWLTMDAADYRSAMMHVRTFGKSVYVGSALSIGCTSHFRCRNCVKYFSIESGALGRTGANDSIIIIQYSMTQLAVSQ